MSNNSKQSNKSRGNPAIKELHILASKAGYKVQHARAVDRINHPNTKIFVQISAGVSVGFASVKDTKAFLANPNRWGFRRSANDVKGEQ